MRRLATILVTVAAVGFAATTANAASVPLVNGNFEDPGTILDVVDSYRGDWTMGPVVGWDVSGAAGVFAPIVPGPAYNSLPSDDRVAWSNGGSLSQLSGTTFQAGSTYTLTVDIGWRLDNSSFAGGEIAIFADDVATVVGSTVLTAPTQGGFTQAVVFLTALDIAPYLGQQIGVLLSGNGQQVNFDNVTLTAAPLPAGIWLMFSALTAMFGLRRFRKA